MSKKFLAALVTGASIALSAPASAIVVGGVDFGTLGEAPTNQHLSSTTIAETLITANGQTLSGYGVIDRVNGDSSYTASGDKLFFFFTDYISTAFTGSDVSFTGGTIQVYLGADFNFLAQSSLANITTIQGYTPWATLSGHADALGYSLSASGTLTGTTISFTGAGLLDVTGGIAEVVSFLDANLIGDGAGGFADIAITTSGNNRVLNPNDICTGQAGQYCIQGSADLRGDTVTVPEPGMLSLLGLGVLGIGASLRKRKSA